ncbi:MAG: gliding motility protein GldN [Muribaculaceae bacterium]|nr:gliding motility protein GldN [Muribaculaceae bacterium]
MKIPSRKILIVAVMAAAAIVSSAQDEGGVVRRRTDGSRARPGQEQTGPQMSERVKNLYNSDAAKSVSDADLQWVRVLYRQIDLNKDENAALYFPEEPQEGQENLFRIIMRLLANNQLAAYEYLDGREVFTDQYRVKVRDVLDRFHILYTDAKGSNEKNPRFEIDDSDVPSNEVLSYYVIERWQYDTRHNRLHPHIEAICPVLHRSGDFGGEAVRYPMFWIKYEDLRPWLTQQTIFIDDNNNLPTCTYDDFFTLAKYDGEIYKTRNLKNRSLMQLYPNADERKRVQDSIQASLDSFESKLWVPTREEVIAAREAREKGDTAAVSPAEEKAKSAVRSPRHSPRKPAARQPKVKQNKPKSTSGSSSNSAARSVRRRK